MESSIRKVIKYAVPFVILPMVVIIGGLYSREKFNAYIIMIVSLLTLALLIFGSEKKGKGSGKVVMTPLDIRSSPFVGSSNKSILGFLDNALARTTSCLSPPEMS